MVAKILIFSLFFSIGLLSQDKVLKQETQITYLQNETGKLVPEGSEIIRLYNDKGKVIQETNKRFWQKVQKYISYTTRYYYDSNNLLDSSVLFDGEKKVLKLSYQYDSTGLATDVVEILPSGAESFKTRYQYNSAKKKIQENLYYPNGQLYNEKEYKYDSKNNLIDEQGKERDSLRYRWIYKYDKKNVLGERKDYDGAGKLIRRHKYENNKEGKPFKETEVTYETNSNIIRVIKYSYEYY